MRNGGCWLRRRFGTIVPPPVTAIDLIIIPSIIQEPSAQRCRLHRRDPTLHGRRAHILHWLVPAAPVAHDAHCTEDEDRRYLTTGAQSMT
eukprot:scaffold75406_cov69-Phaeocystis_antarctica.AAC.2